MLAWLDGNGKVQQLRDIVFPDGSHIAQHASVAVTSGGGTPYRNINVQTPGSVIKSLPGQIYGGVVTNQAASARFLRFYDKSTTPIPASDVPVLTIALPAGAVVSLLGADVGIQFLTGIAVRASNLIADTDTTAPTANDVVLNLLFN